MSLKDKVISLRMKKGMNQKQLSDASELTQATISRIESGSVQTLRTNALKRLAKALGVTVDYLIDNTEEITEEEKVRIDKDTRVVLRGYESLSSGARKELQNFLLFLKQQEAGKKTQEGGEGGHYS
ncbi:MAG: helix-turn-helix domain-containing protein [Armatimonadota bacterium]